LRYRVPENAPQPLLLIVEALSEYLDTPLSYVGNASGQVLSLSRDHRAWKIRSRFRMKTTMWTCILGMALFTELVAAQTLLAAQNQQKPNKKLGYVLPAVAQEGGPVYVIPGTVTEASTINLTSVSGTICVRDGKCMNAAGVTTKRSSSGPGKVYRLTEEIGAFRGTWDLGALLLSIEGVGTRQVFPATAKNGLNSKAPPTYLSLSIATFASLGFPSFSTENARITFFVADSYYRDNRGEFLLTLQSHTVTYNSATPTQKVIQVVGPCDWAAWNLSAGPCNPTAASIFPSQVLGTDLGYSFEDKKTGRLIFLFGDTIGVQLQSGVPLVPHPQTPNQFLSFGAADALAGSKALEAGANFGLDFFKAAGSDPPSPVFVTPVWPGPPPVPVNMGAFNVPNSGIYLNGENYIVVDTGAQAALSKPNLFEFSVLVKYVSNKDFIAGRNISTANVGTATNPIPDGHFVFTTLHELPLRFAQQLGLSEPAVLIFGNAQYRSESVYLSYIPTTEFWSGVDNSNNPATRYFAGLDANGVPTWTTAELCAVPVVYDNPTGIRLTAKSSCTLPDGSAYSIYTDPGTAGNASVAYNDKLGLWLMTWDGGRQSTSTTGIYFSYSSMPWGPWSPPQLIYNACDAHRYKQGYGDLIRYTYGGSNPDICGGTVPNNSGPPGPIIGTAQDPFYGASNGEKATSRRGGVYAPYQVERFATVQNNTLNVYFNMSTWNPYTVVLMQSNFTIAP
jgi:hypothetical protein